MAVTSTSTLLAGLQASYDALGTYDSTKLYFCTDTRNMYKGADLYTDGIRAVTTDPTTPAVGVIYYNTTDDVLKFYDGSAWTTIRLAMASSVSSASTDEQIPTAAAVYTYVTEAIEEATNGGDVVNSVTAGTADATITVTSGDNSSTVTVPGVVTTPSYDADTRTITLPVSDGTTLTIALGKDIFVDTTAANGYDATTQEIVLYLNDGTEIRVPASSLVDVYTGDSTTTATVAVSDANVITASVILSTDANNSLVVDATNGGLLVDLSSYATIAYVDDAVDSIDSTIATLQDEVDANTAAIATLNGDATTEGSVAKAIADAEATINSTISDLHDEVDANTAAIEVLNGDEDTEGSVAKAVADAVEAASSSLGDDLSALEARVAQNETDIATLAAALEWGEF